jgi:hypothetical protein
MIRPVKHRYGSALVLIIILLIFQMAAPDTGWSRAVAILLEGILLVWVFHASQVHHLLRRAAEAAAILATVAAIVTLVGVGDSAPDAYRVINVLLIAVAPPVIGWGVIGSIRDKQGVTLPAVAGVLCVYLLMGMVFASLYGAVASIGSGDFFAGDQPTTISDFLYFSYTTLTTTGYGDLVPTGDLARSLAILEQLVGAIYLVTVVAVLVSNLKPRRA